MSVAVRIGIESPAQYLHLRIAFVEKEHLGI